MFRGKCKRCRQALTRCEICKGEGAFSRLFSGFQKCTSCNGTGSLCPRHGKHHY